MRVAGRVLGYARLVLFFVGEVAKGWGS